ncbi:MAG: DUF4345 domain-containing protein [Bacteroidota bacterium]
MELFEVIILSLSSLALFYASTMRLINPQKGNFLQTYLSNPDNRLENDTDLINEIRGVGAVMLVGGLFIILGIVISDFKFTSFVVAVVIFFGVVLGRLISLVVDGKPNQDVIRATIAEIVLSVLNIFCLIDLLL